MSKSKVKYVVEWRFKDRAAHVQNGWSFDARTLAFPDDQHQPPDGFTTLAAARKYKNESQKASPHVKTRIAEVTLPSRRIVK